ncbi:hypothetical protein [Methylobacterium sp. Leaf108]|uniref:hypothetical protein n=1 Tax=Methylobacterium sp. Leaf108 TaxID=1736256 RepID=UPI0012E96FA9|nr:hypothetical protein [Methylobacterium sp. Leaf108]
MDAADIATEGSRKHWTLNVSSNNIEFKFKKERQRGCFGERVDDILIAIGAEIHEVPSARLPSKPYGRC